MLYFILSNASTNNNSDIIQKENRLDLIEFVKNSFPSLKINIKMFKIKNKTFYYGTINNNFVFLSKEDFNILLDEGYKIEYYNNSIFFEASEVYKPGLVLIKKRSFLHTLDKFVFKNYQNIPLYDFTKRNEIYIIPILFDFLRFYGFDLHRIDIKTTDDKKIKDIKIFQQNTVNNLVSLMDSICSKIKQTISLEQEDKIKKLKIYQEIIKTLPSLEEIPEDTSNMMKVLFKEAETSISELHPQFVNNQNLFDNISENIDKKIKTTFFDISKIENELFISPYLIYNKIPIDKNKSNFLYCYINQKQDKIKILTTENLKEIYYDFKKFDNINYLALIDYLDNICKSINNNLKLYFSNDTTPYIWLDYIEMNNIKNSPLDSLKINFEIGLSLLKLMYCYFKDKNLLSNGQVVSFLKQLIKIHNKYEKTEINLQDLPDISEEEISNLKRFITEQMESFKLIAEEQNEKKQKFLLYKTQILYNISEIFEKYLISYKDDNFIILGTAKHNTTSKKEDQYNNLIIISSEDLLELYEHGFLLKNTFYFYRKISNEFGGEIDTQIINTIYSLEKYLHNISKYDFEIAYLPENTLTELTIKISDSERSFDIRLLLYQYLKNILNKDILTEIVESNDIFKDFKGLNIKKISEQELKDFQSFVNDNIIE